MAKFKVAPNTRKTYLQHLRGFLKYLYYEKKILKKDLASLLVGAPLFDQVKPPKFLRPQEVEKLFSNLQLSTDTDVRTCAMVYLAYTLGLRPIEISKITLDDISFSEGNASCAGQKNQKPCCPAFARDDHQGHRRLHRHGKTKGALPTAFFNMSKSHKTR